MNAELLKCPSCSANLPPVSYYQGAVTCEYCGATVMSLGGWPLPVLLREREQRQPLDADLQRRFDDGAHRLHAGAVA